jgi:hypothetical protein
MLSTGQQGAYMLVSATGSCMAVLPPAIHPAYNAFVAEWQQACQPTATTATAAPGHSNLNSGLKLVGNGLKLLNTVANAATGNNDPSSGAGGAVVGLVTSGIQSNNVDMSSIWQPLQSAALGLLQ